MSTAAQDRPAGTEPMIGANGSDLGLMLRAVLTGFDGARHRLNTAAVPGAPPEAVYVPLAEALWWAVIVDNGFEELANTGGLHRWPTRKHRQDTRNADRSGRVLVGLRYARDRCGHQPALMALEDGWRLPLPPKCLRCLLPLAAIRTTPPNPCTRTT